MRSTCCRSRSSRQCCKSRAKGDSFFAWNPDGAGRRDHARRPRGSASAGEVSVGTIGPRRTSINYLISIYSMTHAKCGYCFCYSFDHETGGVPGPLLAALQPCGIEEGAFGSSRLKGSPFDSSMAFAARMAEVGSRLVHEAVQQCRSHPSDGVLARVKGSGIVVPGFSVYSIEEAPVAARLV